MSARDELRERLLSAVKGLGDLADSVVLVGGCAPAAWELSSSVSDLRPTEDIDVIVATPTHVTYLALVQRMKAEAGLKEDQTEGAPLCRYRLGDLIIDIMPIEPRVLGFSNAWYGRAYETARRRELAPGVGLRVITPTCFVATKLEALAGRGRGDFLVSTDLEDIVTAFMGIPGLVAAMRSGNEDIHAFVRTRLRDLLGHPGFTDAWVASAAPDVQQQAVASLMLHELAVVVSTQPGPVRARVRLASGQLEYSVPRQALLWSRPGSKDRSVAQADVDRAGAADPDATRELVQCWAPDPFSERLVNLPVDLIGCECSSCIGLPEPPPPCWACETCLREAILPCSRCGLERRVISTGLKASASRGRAVTATSLRCRLHDHDACPRCWDGNGSTGAACACDCHRPATS